MVGSFKSYLFHLIYTLGSDIIIKSLKDLESSKDKDILDNNKKSLFTISRENDKNGIYFLYFKIQYCIAIVAVYFYLKTKFFWCYSAMLMYGCIDIALFFVSVMLDCCNYKCFLSLYFIFAI